jgi:long-chain acyl-CoA synthetase
MTIHGRENLDGFDGPAIFIGNHSSHLDSLTLSHALPARFQRRLSFGSAADRFFVKGRKGLTKQPWWSVVTMNTWPIKRGGGRSSLEYGEWLLDKKWSLVIFPEGTRSTTGRMSHFKHGVSLIALAKDVPVVPVYMEGLRAIRPKGARAEKPGPVTVMIGKPIHFAPGTEVADATREMYHAMEALQAQAKAIHPRTVPAPEMPVPAGAVATGGGS